MMVELWVDGVRETTFDWNARLSFEGDDVFEEFEDEVAHMFIGDSIDMGDGWIVKRVG